MLSTCDASVTSCCVWRAGLQEKPTLALPFAESYQLFLKVINENDVPVVVNYLQYRAFKQNSDEALVKATGKLVCPVVLKGVSSCFPTRKPNEGELCLMLDMYSAFYADEEDNAVNGEFSRYERELNNFDYFSDYVMQIAASHTQFTDSKMDFDETRCLKPEPYYNNARYREYLERAKSTRIGVVNLVIKDDKRMVAAIELGLDEDCGKVRAINIPLNTLHVYALPFDQIESKQNYWRRWIDKREEK